MKNKLQRNHLLWIGAITLIITTLYVFTLDGNSSNQSDQIDTTNYHSTTGGLSYEYHLPLTKEEADALRGTGYHNTRPHSFAENLELAAAQVTCRACGRHSDNGSNSLCDYCYKEEYD